MPKPSAAEPEENDDVVEFFIPDNDALAQQREKFCIQCLEILGEYVEVLGPVLHEKGVDVCIALLQRYSNDKKELEILAFLPDVLKLICALAAHRKFAAMFVDRGGIQKLLAVPRVPQTFFGLSSCLFTIGSLQVRVKSWMDFCLFQLWLSGVIYLFTTRFVLLVFFFYSFKYLFGYSKRPFGIFASGDYGACLCSSFRYYLSGG